jgi:predicted outer membrane protein
MNIPSKAAFSKAGDPRRRATTTTVAAWVHVAVAGLLCAGMWAATGAAAQRTALDKDAANATTHSRVSDGDRVFMRSASARLIHDQQLADLARERSARAEVRRFANDWKTASARHGKELAELAQSHEVAIPNNMSEQSSAQLRRLGEKRSGEFDAHFARQANESLAQEVKLFQDSVRKMENDTIRAWANAALTDLRALAARANAMAARTP